MVDPCGLRLRGNKRICGSRPQTPDGPSLARQKREGRPNFSILPNIPELRTLLKEMLSVDLRRVVRVRLHVHQRLKKLLDNLYDDCITQVGDLPEGLVVSLDPPDQSEQGLPSFVEISKGVEIASDPGSGE